MRPRRPDWQVDPLEPRRLLSVSPAEVNVWPMSNPGGPYVVAEGGRVDLISNASDTDGFVTRLDWDLDFDGTTFDYNANVPTYADARFTFDARTQQANGPSTRTIALRAEDNGGAVTITTTTLQVTNVAPGGDVTGSALAEEGVPYAITLTATDPGPDDITWSIDWGDGSTSAAAGRTATPSHVYSDGPSRFVITASVSDGVATVPLPAGNLDVSFGTGGVRFQKIAPGGGINVRTLRQPDGKLVVLSNVDRNVPPLVGDRSPMKFDIQLARFNADGSLDRGFGVGGFARTDLGTDSDDAADAVLMPDGKIAVAATAGSNAVVLRYNADGSPDDTFGDHGTVRITLTANGAFGRGIAVSPGGKLLLLGESNTYQLPATEAFLARFNPDGSLDATYGDGGVSTSTGILYSGARVSPKAIKTAADGSAVFVASAYQDQVIVQRLTSAGRPDPTFQQPSGMPPVITWNSARFQAGEDLLIMPDGKVVIAGAVDVGSRNGFQPNFAAARLNNNGTLDASFGDGGLVTTGIQGWTHHLALQPDGRILMVGGEGSLDHGSGGVTTGVVRLTSAGRVDPTWGGGGGRSVNFNVDGAMQYIAPAAASDDVVVLPSGDLMVVGTGFDGATYGAAFARLIGGDVGQISVPVQDVAPTLHLTATGRGGVGVPYVLNLGATDPGDDHISGWTVDWGDGAVQSVAAGPVSHTYAAGGQYTISAAATDEDGLHRGGGIDPTLAAGGVLVPDLPTLDHAQPGAVIALPDGRLLFVATVLLDSNPFVGLARHNADGSPDLTFGPNGRRLVSVAAAGGISVSSAALVNGKILAVGSTGSTGGTGNSIRPALARFNLDGSLDTTFGVGGAVADPDFGIGNAFFQHVAVQSDGSIVAAGQLGVPFSPWEFIVARFAPNGQLDTTFGTGGKIVTNLGPASTNARPELAVLPDDSILLTGDALSADRWSTVWAAFKFTPDGVPDSTFGTGGASFTGPIDGFDVTAFAMAVQPDGKFLLAGQAYHRFTFYRPRVAVTRFNADGTVDPTFADGGSFIDRQIEGELAVEMVVLPDGRILLSDDLTVGNPPAEREVLRVLLPDGRPDSSFGSGGRLVSTTEVAQYWGGLTRTPDGAAVSWGLVRRDDAQRVAATKYRLRAESRVVVAGGARVSSALLTITGSESADAIAFGRSGDNFTVTLDGGVTYSFPATDVRRVVVNALGGDDVVTVAPGAGPIDGITVNGGNGNDTFMVAPGGGTPTALSFLGGPGDDTMVVPAAATGDVSYDGGSGLNTLRLEGTGGPDTFVVTRDTARVGGVTVHVALTGINEIVAIGSGGDDTIGLNSKLGLNEPLVRVEGGDGADRIDLRGTNSGDSLELLKASGQSVLRFNDSNVFYDGVEALDVDAAGGVDQIVVNGVATGTTATVRGGDANDRFVLPFTALFPYLSTIGGTVVIDGGAGNDFVDFADYGSPPFTYDLTPTRLTRGGATPLVFDYSAVENVTLRTGGAPDLIHVTPGASTAFVISAGEPNSAPGDRLYVDTAGTTDPLLTPTGPGAGQFTFADRKPVTFAEVEHVNDPPPYVVSREFRPQGPAVAFTFSEDVRASLEAADLTVRNAATGALATVSNPTYDVTTNTAAYSLGRLVAGHYVVGLSGAGVFDSAGSSLAPDGVFEFDVAPASLFADGTLSIVGTDAADVILIARSADGSQVIATLNGTNYPFPAAGVNRVDVWSGAGIDALTLGAGLALAVVFDGGAGPDQLSLAGTPGDDVFDFGTARLVVNALPAIDYANLETLAIGAGGGSDLLRPLPGPAGPTAVFDGGAGSDRVEIRVPLGDSFSLGASFSVQADQVTGGARRVRYSNVEAIDLYGSDSPDVFSVFGTAAGTTVSAFGMGGNDRLGFAASTGGGPGDLSSLGADFLFDGGAGANDSVTAGDVSTGPVAPARTYVVTDASISRAGATGRLLLAGTEAVAFSTSTGADAVRVTPSAVTTFTLNGLLPTAAPGDRLDVDLAGATGARRVNGQYTFSNRKPITFTGFESFNDVIAPQVLFVTFNPDTRVATARFSEDVSASLGVADLEALNQVTGQVFKPASVSYSAGTNTATFTFDSLPAGNYLATLVAAGVTDPSGNALESGHPIAFTIAGVAARRLFYNDSAFDGHDPLPTSADDGAVAPGLSGATAPGGPTRASSVSGYTRGINGVLIDFAGLFLDISLDDFEFRVGPGGDPAGWAPAPRPTGFAVRVNEGPGGTHRIMFTWPNGAIRNTWLQVTMRATDKTLLPAPDVFYFASLVGDGADPASPGAVRPADLVRTRLAMAMARGSAPVGSPYDFNRDGRVNALDLAVVRRALSSSLPPVVVPAPPQSGAASIARRPADDLLR